MAFPLRLFYFLALLGSGLAVLARAEPPVAGSPGRKNTPVYHWRDLSVAGTADLSVLFCHPAPGSGESPGPAAAGSNVKDVPLIAVLRDTLGEPSSEHDRLTYLWLLTYERPGVPQRLLSAVPFFYWHPAEGAGSAHQKDTRPLLNLAAPEHAVLSDGARDLLQWTALDPSVTAVRATSRMYRTNETDHERLKIEEAISYLRQAPVSDDGIGLNRDQINTVIARLELRKKLLGGLVTQRQAARIGSQVSEQQAEIRMRNWELLRQCADKTGLVFEPLNVAATTDQYAMLWFPLGKTREPAGTSLGPVWKLLNIHDPWNGVRLRDFSGRTFVRRVDSNGALLPADATQGDPVNLAPLAVYSLNYPKAPLLMMDFRNSRHVRWHEMTQRSINEVTAGVIGISHFTNWYFYAGADLYDFYVGRHGAAVDQAARLDCYSQFRVELSVDRQLDSTLRRQMGEHIESLEINPLETNPRLEMAAAWARYAQLEEEARPNGPMLTRIARDRRQELAVFGESDKAVARDKVLHELSLGLYTHRTQPVPDELRTLDSYRRAQYQLAFLDSMVTGGTAPEVSYDASRIEDSVTELSGLMPELKSAGMRAHATATLAKLERLSRDYQVQANCEQAIASIQRGRADTTPGMAGGMPGVALRVSEAQQRQRP